MRAGVRVKKPERADVQCLRCDYQWTPRVQQPRECPYCKSTRWNEPRREAK